MIHDYYAIHDRATQSFRPPFESPTEASAIRSTRAAIASMSRETLDLHVADLSLMHVGAFDDSTGTFLPSNPRLITPVAALAATIERGNEASHGS